MITIRHCGVVFLNTVVKTISCNYPFNGSACEWLVTHLSEPVDGWQWVAGHLAGQLEPVPLSGPHLSRAVGRLDPRRGCHCRVQDVCSTYTEILLNYHQVSTLSPLLGEHIIDE
jgi:hypothetical protein